MEPRSCRAGSRMGTRDLRIRFSWPLAAKAATSFLNMKEKGFQTA